MHEMTSDEEEHQQPAPTTARKRTHPRKAKPGAYIEERIKNYSPFGRFVRRRQATLGKPMEYLANEVGMSPYHLYEWLKGEWPTLPNPYYLERLAESLGLPFLTLARMAVHNVETEEELPPVERDPYYRLFAVGLLYDLLFASGMPARDVEDVLLLAESRFARLPERQKRRVHTRVYWHQHQPLRRRLAEERRKEEQAGGSEPEEG